MMHLSSKLKCGDVIRYKVPDKVIALGMRSGEGVICHIYNHHTMISVRDYYSLCSDQIVISDVQQVTTGIGA